MCRKSMQKRANGYSQVEIGIGIGIGPRERRASNIEAKRIGKGVSIGPWRSWGSMSVQVHG